MSPKVATTNLPPVQRSPQSRPIPIDRPQAAPIHRQRALTGSFSSGAPSLDIPGLATSASTPAILPDMDFSRSPPVSGGAWQSMAAADYNGGTSLSPVTQTPPSTAALSPTVDTSARGDYFSQRRKEQSPTRAEDKTVSSSPASVPIPPTPSTPGGSKLKFTFGKKKKSETPMTTVAESKEVAPEPEEVVSPPHTCSSSSNIRPRRAYEERGDDRVLREAC